MKSLKKTLVLLVVFSMILSAVMPAFAATDVYGLDCEEEVARLEALKVVTGYEDGTYKPENTITRAEMAVILCKMVGIDTVTVEESKNVPSKFSDVAAGEWYTGYINVAAGKGLLSGFPDGTFRPSEQLTMNQVLTLCVNALGRGEYVAEMGTWPANYIAEATKLGLVDGVSEAGGANRGNVAIIVWNTLEAPYVWDVSQTEYEGTINLGNSTRSLLSIYFRDYVYGEDSDILKEAEYMTVAQTPATDGELGEKQLVLRAEDEYAEAFWDAFSVRPKRGTDEEEATIKREYADDEYEIVAYAPNHDDLDSYYGKVVTVIFGKDNEVVSIRVVDETVDNEYLTAWEDSKLEIGSNKYKFATDHSIYMNTVKVDDMDEVFEILDIEDPTDFNKVIKANVVLNNSGKVTRLDLFVSGTYEAIYTKEAIVEKVRNEIITLSNDDEIDYSDDVDEDDLPRVIKDNVIASVEDIEVGDVLTYFYDANDNITTVYVSSTKVEGELTRASKTDLKLTVDGEAYYSSMAVLMVTNDKISDAESKENVDDYIGENVELYMNIYGEYVLMASDEASEDWTFGIVTSVRDTEDDEEDDDVYYIPVRILLADGTTSREYKFIYDVEDDEDDLDTWEDWVAAFEDELIVFSATANKEIEYEDAAVVTEAELANFTEGDYDAMSVAAATEVDDDRQRIEGKIFASSTVIFNTGDGDKATVSSSWKMLIEDEELAQEALLIFEEDDKTLSYVLIDVNEDDYATSDAEYAIVETEDYKEKRGTTTKKYTELLTVDGVEEFEAKSLNGTYTDGLEEYFVEYALSGSKLESASALINLPEFKKLKAGEAVTDEVMSGEETTLVVTLVAATTTEEVDAVHGTVACEHADETTAKTCDGCTLVTAYQAPVDALHADGCSKATETTVTECDECTLVRAYQAEVDAVHGTVACEHADETTAKTCDGCTLVTAYQEATETEGTIKANFKVIDTQKLLIEYEDDEDEVESSFGEIILDEDVVVYDARNGELKETTFSALRDEVAEDGYGYVIPFANEDAYGYGTEDVEANILVIVD